MHVGIMTNTPIKPLIEATKTNFQLRVLMSLGDKQKR